MKIRNSTRLTKRYHLLIAFNVQVQMTPKGTTGKIINKQINVEAMYTPNICTNRESVLKNMRTKIT